MGLPIHNASGAFLPSGLLAAENLNMLDPVSPPAESIRVLTWFVFAIAGVIFLLVEGVLLFSLARFRQRGAPGEPAVEPPQVYGSKPIEIAWTAAPTLVVFLLILVIVRTVYEVRVDPNNPPPDSEPLYVTVIGHQWWWEYVYDKYKGQELFAEGGAPLITANELHVPASDDDTPRPVYLTLKSADVSHSYWVPRLAGKTDLIPGRVNRMWFQTAETGTYLGQCAEYCGNQHANMLLRVVVDSPADFERWLEGQRKPAANREGASEGRKLFLGQSCVNCHRVRGTPAAGTYAPDLTHLKSRQKLGAGIIPNTPENLRRWVTNPQAIKPGCLMPGFGLSERDFALIANYLGTLD